jgi:acetyl/propionyl-CoA carboxylase alpha subunit
MARALDELVVVGVDTSAAFHRRVMEEDDFRAGRLSIRYVEEHPDLVDGNHDEGVLAAAAVTAALMEEEDRQRHRTPRIADGGEAGGGMSAWRRSGWPWRTR